MALAENESIRRWSTVGVDISRRLDYFASALSESVAPMSVASANADSFHVELSSADFGEISVAKATGAAHRIVRGKSELSRSSEQSFNLLIGLKAPWSAEHQGTVRMMPRDVLLFDTDRRLIASVLEDYSAVNVSMPERWIRQWIPDPSKLTGQRIPGDSLWGLTLSSYLSELSPELVRAPPLPLSLIADQVGSLLALTAGVMCAPEPPPTRGTRDLRQRIAECIAQRCTEMELTATDVASALGVSVRTLHRALASAGESFGGRLIGERTRVGVRMLSSPLFKRVTNAEIGRRAGFTSHSHFARVIRQQTGLTPRQIRAAQNN